jgi:DNA-directed RNA polymerase specialized sigma24 family protein
MKKQWDTTQQGFDELLDWLDDNRDEAGKKYELIRQRLIKMFTCRACGEPEDLADETINRVTTKIFEIVPNYQGDPALYFYGVARMVHHEYLRRQNRLIHPPPTDVTNEDERLYGCLDGCMETLPEKSRQLVLRYYQNEKKVKIDDRKTLADELGIAVNALRIRAHRIRTLLRKCVENCVEQLPVN